MVKMKGMCQIVTWSIRDESHHVENMIKLFHALIDENRKVWNDNFKKTLYQICRDMVDLEDKFIDLAFEMGGVQGLEPKQVKQYIRHIADRRLLQLGLKPNFKVKTNPLDWLDWIINGDSFKNFFEGTVTDYNADGMSGDSWGWELVS